jgi:amidohydrolase
MIQDGAMQGVDAVVGLHSWDTLPVGTVALSPGPQMAAAGKFSVHIRGQGGHGAWPHRTTDPIVLAAQAILALQTVVSRRISPLQAAVVTVGTIHGGTRDNIIPNTVELTGTLRSLDLDVYDQIKAEIRRALGIVRALGGEVEIEFGPNYHVTSNDPELTQFVSQVAADLLGADAVQPADPVMGGEDFGVLARSAPGCFIRLGISAPNQPPQRLHHPQFDVDEQALPIGSAILAETALRYLKG